jgi:hypothetical protein
VPNFLAAQTAAKLLCVEGLYLEGQRQYGGALDRYLAVLTMGRDYSAPDGTLISWLISIAIENIALERIHDLVAAGQIGRDQLARVLERLEVVASTQSTTRQALSGEIECMRWTIRRMREHPQEIRKMYGGDSFADKAFFLTAAAQADRIEDDYDRFWDFELEYLRTPYWKRNRTAHERKRDALFVSLHPFLRMAIPNFLEADTRYQVTSASLRLTQVATALEACRLDTGAYPVRLDALVPKYLDTMPVDPFSGEKLKYELAPTGDHYTLYSVGPDQIDDARATRYSPQNGTMSEGDIFYDSPGGALPLAAP